MNRPTRAFSILVLGAALMAPIVPATAGPPGTVDSTPLVIPAGVGCSFSVSLLMQGKAGSNNLPHSPRYFAITTSPGFTVTVAKADDLTHAVTVNATGAFRYAALPDGRVEVRTSGRNVLYDIPGIEGKMLATNGPVTVILSPDFVPLSVDVSHAQSRDLCAEIA